MPKSNVWKTLRKAINFSMGWHNVSFCSFSNFSNFVFVFPNLERGQTLKTIILSFFKLPSIYEIGRSKRWIGKKLKVFLVFYLKDKTLCGDKFWWQMSSLEIDFFSFWAWTRSCKERIICRSKAIHLTRAGSNLNLQDNDIFIRYDIVKVRSRIYNDLFYILI